MSRSRTHDPKRLDLRACATDGDVLSGEVDQAEMDRLAAGLLATDSAPPRVAWRARAEWRPVKGGSPELWLALQAETHVTQQCQRCLQPMTLPLAVDRQFRFVADEDEAARLDEESEDDVLVERRRFDLVELLEDELILALPIVPRHDTCPQPLPMSAGPDAAEDTPDNPFAALAALRRPGGD